MSEAGADRSLEAEIETEGSLETETDADGSVLASEAGADDG